MVVFVLLALLHCMYALLKLWIDVSHAYFFDYIEDNARLNVGVWCA